MATNPYSYGTLGTRWTVGEPTSKSLLDISRVKNDANRWTLEQLITDPDDSATLGFGLSFASSEQRLLQIHNTDISKYFQIYGGRAGSPTSDHLVFSTGTNGTIMEFDGANHWITFHDTAGVQKMYYRGDGSPGLILESGVFLTVGGLITASAGISGTTGTFSGDFAINTSTLKVDTSNNRVGVKNASPSYPLDIGYTAGINQVAWRGSSNEIGFLTFGSSTDAGAVQLSSGGAAKILFDAAGNSYINTESNFGIGTSSPSAKVDIPIPSYNASTTAGMIRFTDSANSSHANIQGYYVGGQGSNLVIGTNAYLTTAEAWTRWSASYGSAALLFHRTGDIYFATNTNAGIPESRMTLTSAGLLGIGTASPSALMHVSQGGSYPTMTANTHAIVGNTSSGSAISRAAIMAGATTGFSVLDFGDTDASNAGGITYSHQYDRLNLCAGAGATRASIDSDGLKFGSDTAAANALDDYEEGTYSVTDQSGAGLSFTVNSSRYVKIGKLVWIGIEIVFPTTSDTNIVYISLPFAQSTAQRASLSCVTNRSDVTVQGYASTGTARLGIIESAASPVSVTNASLSGKYVIIGGVYEAA